MRVVSINNLKGGTGKSTTAINLSENLASKGYKILLIDNDKQGNTSDFYNRFNEELKGTHNMLTDEEVDMKCLIMNTDYKNLDIISTNLNLLIADKKIMFDTMRPQQTRYKEALEQVKDFYDYCIIDNAPSLDISVINSICASDEIIIPMKVDNFSTQGLEILMDQLESLTKHFNKNLDTVSLLFTQVQHSKYIKDGITEISNEFLKDDSTRIKRNVYNTKIRHTVEVVKSTFEKQPLSEYNPRATATEDYLQFTNEFLGV